MMSSGFEIYFLYLDYLKKKIKILNEGIIIKFLKTVNIVISSKNLAF